MCAYCRVEMYSWGPSDLSYAKWKRAHEIIKPIKSGSCKYDQGLDVLYQLIKRQHLDTDDPRLMTKDMQVLLIIIFDMNHEFYVQVLFWFLDGGTDEVRSKVDRMRKDFCQGQRYPKEGVHVKYVDYFYTKASFYGGLEIVWIQLHYRERAVDYTKPGSIF